MNEIKYLCAYCGAGCRTPVERAKREKARFAKQKAKDAYKEFDASEEAKKTEREAINEQIEDRKLLTKNIRQKISEYNSKYGEYKISAPLDELFDSLFDLPLGHGWRY